MCEECVRGVIRVTRVISVGARSCVVHQLFVFTHANFLFD